jgi:hypothetical protein
MTATPEFLKRTMVPVDTKALPQGEFWRNLYVALRREGACGPPDRAVVLVVC